MPDCMSMLMRRPLHHERPFTDRGFRCVGHGCVAYWANGLELKSSVQRWLRPHRLNKNDRLRIGMQSNYKASSDITGR